MIDGKRVVAWTPFGRERTVSLLYEYMRRDVERGIVDEWWLCMNTDPTQNGDILYAMKLQLRHPWVKLVDKPEDAPRLQPKQRNTGYFYRYMTDRDTVFVRFDDDIVFVDIDAVERIVRHRLETQVGVASFGMIWNNAICSWYAQQHGVIPHEFGTVGRPYCMDPVGWADGQFAVRIHNLLLDYIEGRSVAPTPRDHSAIVKSVRDLDPAPLRELEIEATPGDKFALYQDIGLEVGQQFSVSFFAALGSMYADLETPGVLTPHEEESWHTVHEPRRLGQPNTIVGNAFVSHYTFFPQQPIVNATNILDRYRALAQKVNT